MSRRSEESVDWFGFAMLVGIVLSLAASFAAPAMGAEAAPTADAGGLLGVFGMLEAWQEVIFALTILPPMVMAATGAVRRMFPGTFKDRSPCVPPATIGRTTQRSRTFTYALALSLGVLSGFFIKVPETWPNADAFGFVLGGVAALMALSEHSILGIFGVFSPRKKEANALDKVKGTFTGEVD